MRIISNLNIIKWQVFFLNNEISIENKNDINTENEFAVENNIDDRRYLAVLDSLFKERDNREVLLYIEDLDWVAKLYGTKDDGLIKKIKNLEKLRKNLVIISMKNLKLLEEFYFENYDEKEVIKIVKASKEEIELCLYRMVWEKFRKNLPNISITELSINFVNSNTSLREIIRIFKKKLEVFGDSLSMDNFEFKIKVREKVLWKDVILNKDIKFKIKSVINLFKTGSSRQKGLLLYGSSGNGKTTIAKAIANEEKMYFLAPKLSELKAKFVGHSAPNIKELFDEARRNEPCLIFLDEIDTLFPKRDFSDSDSYNKDMTNEFLQQLDGVDNGEQKIFILSATNREYAIDDAVKSRLGFPILISFPEENELIQIYDKALKKTIGADFFSLLNEELKKSIIKKSSQLSGRDIINVCANLKNKLKHKNINILKKDNEKFNKFIKEILNYCFDDLKIEIIQKMKTKGLICLSPKELKRENIQLFGLDKIKTILEHYSNETRENSMQKKLRKLYNIDRQNGILLYGTPGNGKTEIVKYMCQKNNLIFVNVNGENFATGTVEECINNLEFIFSETYKLSNQCEEDEGIALFFDEFDSIANKNMNNLIRGILLTKFSDNKVGGIRHNENKVIVLAATNFYDFIDEAIKRAGRFDEHIFLPNPNTYTAIEIISQLLKIENIHIDEENIKYFYFELKRVELLKLLLNNSQSQNIKKSLELYNFDLRLINQDFFTLNESKQKNLVEFLEKIDLCSSATLKIYVNKLKVFLFRNALLSFTDALHIEEEILKDFFNSL